MDFFWNIKTTFYDALRDLVPFEQFKYVKNTHGGVLLLVLKVTLLHGCFSRFLNCTNGTALPKTLHMSVNLYFYSFLHDHIRKSSQMFTQLSYLKTCFFYTHFHMTTQLNLPILNYIAILEECFYCNLHFKCLFCTKNLTQEFLFIECIIIIPIHKSILG